IIVIRPLENNRYRTGRNGLGSLNDIALRKRRVGGDAVVSEAGQIEALVAPVHDQLRNRAAGGGGLLRAVAGKTGRKVQIRYLRVRTDNGVLVQAVVVVVSGPGVHDLDALESRHTVREAWPDFVLEERVVDLVQIADRRLLILGFG